MEKISIKERFQKVLKPVGFLLTGASFVFIFFILKDFDYSKLNIDNLFIFVLYLILFGIVFVFFMLILAYLWKIVVDYLGKKKYNTGNIIYIYFSANISKYLPGNVFHYVGRNYLGSKIGIPNSDMAISSILEIILSGGFTFLAILIFLITGLAKIPASLPFELNFTKIIFIVCAGLLLTGLLFSVLLIYNKKKRNKSLKDLFTDIKTKLNQFLTLEFLKTIIIYFIIFIISMLSVTLMFYLYTDLLIGYKWKPEDFFNITAAISIAGFSSILTPGVPGGLGVKESVTVLLLSIYGYDQGIIIISGIIMRIIYIIADILCYFIALFFFKPKTVKTDLKAGI